MGYHVLIAPITQRIVPTDNLFKPAKEEFFYTEDAVVKEFDTAIEAFNFVQLHIPFDEHICIPGDGNGLEMYAQMWAGINEMVLENLPNMSRKLKNIENFDFSYGKNEYDDLMESINDYEKVIKPEDRIQDGKYVVDGYVFEKSNLLQREIPITLMFSDREFDFKNLSLEDQKKCLISNTEHVWVNEGFVFDLYCKKHSKYPWLYAWYLYSTHELRSSVSRCRYKTTVFVKDLITKFNAFRIKHNMYEL